LRFIRKLSWEAGKLHVTDELHARKGWANVRAVAIACSPAGNRPDETEASALAQLQQWMDLTEQLHELPLDAPLRIDRVF
jgi:hypothetical protein